MRNLILLTALLATSALADVSVRVNRIEASVIDNAEESANQAADAEAPAQPIDHNASRSNSTRSSVRPAATADGEARKTKQAPDASKARKKGYDHYTSIRDTAAAKASMQKARHDAKSKVEVRGSDAEKKDTTE